MRISCPECHSYYEVNLPNLDEKGVTVECAKCHHHFPVRKEAPATTTASQESTEDSSSPALETVDPPQESPPAEPETPSAEIDEEKMLAALFSENESPDTTQKPASDEESLDDSISETPDSTEPSDENLDDLLDNLINEEAAAEQETPEMEEAVVDSIEIADDFEKLLDENPPDETVEIAEDAEDVEEGIKEPPQEDETTEDMIEQMLREDTEVDADDDRVPEESPFDNNAVITDKDPAGASSDLEDALDELFIEPGEAKTETATSEATADAETEKSQEELLVEAFADHEKALAEGEHDGDILDEDDEGKSEEDLLAEAFAEQEKTADQDTEEALDVEDEGKSDRELFVEAFTEQEENENDTAEAATETETIEEETAAEDEEDEDTEEEEAEDEEAEDEEAATQEEADEETEDEDELEEEYEDEEDDYEEEEEAPAKKLFGFIPVPAEKTGKFFIGGGALAVLLIAGGLYFSLKTSSPPAQPNLQDKALVEEAKRSQEKAAPPGETTAKPAPTDAAGNAQNAQTAESGKIIEQSDQSAAVSKTSQAAPDNTEVKAKNPQETGILAAVAPTDKTVTLSAIMPIAFNVTDIRILSFNLEIELNNNESAKVVRDALPVYEKIMIQTVERFFRNRFFNDILYVREKLQKRLQTAFNKSLQGGRVKKAKFKDFETS